MRPPHVNEIHHSNARTLLTSLALSTHDTVRAAGGSTSRLNMYSAIYPQLRS